jgi:hypothetical protein
VVLATYVTDDPDHPEAPEESEDNRIPTAVYCDVLCYMSLPGLRYVALQQVLVMQEPGGIQSGRIWKPRATTMDISQAELDVDGPTEVADMDGDHVLIGFIEGNPNEPVIVGGVPHPNRDLGNEDKATGRRLGLKLEDGDPNLVKHHGTFWGVLTNGDWILDTTYANDGTLQDEDGVRGHEQPPPDDGTGAQRFRLPPAAEQLTEWVDHITTPDEPAVMSSARDTTELRQRQIQHTGTVIDELLDYTDPDSPESQAHVSLTAAVREILIKDAGAIWRVILAEGSSTLEAQNADGDAELKVGDGEMHVALVEALQALWEDLISWLDAHTHSTGVGPSGTPLPPLAATGAPWDTAINSTKLSLPDG